MANKNLIGSFVFRSEGDNCLTSKYFHGNQPYPFVEACKKLDDDSGQHDGFSGNYKTVWIQDNHQHMHANLSIVWQPNNTYTLTWTNENDEEIFFGIGMIYDKLLIGAYWD